MPPKKKQKLDIPIPALDGLGEDATTVRDALLSFRQQDARELLLSLMSCYGIPHLKLPPGPTFSSASWMQVCSDFGLSEDKGLLQLALFDLPDLCLPPSIHNRMLTAAMRAMDVYQEPQSHRTAEASNVRLFEAWHVPLCQLFRGRIIDKPEQRMPGTNLTSGGRVEHELFVLNQGIILLVYELKLIIHGVVGQEEAAQVFLEMHAAWTSNSEKGFSPQPPVYALLTDLDRFVIFKYDGETFERQLAMSTCGDATRSEYLYSMMPSEITHEAPSLSPYSQPHSLIQSLKDFSPFFSMVSSHNSKQFEINPRGVAKSVSPLHSDKVTVPVKKAKHPAPRPSFDNWQRAHMFAVQAREILMRPALTRSLEEAESEGQKGLDRLDESVCQLDKIGSVSDWEEAEMNDEVQALIGRYFQ